MSELVIWIWIVGYVFKGYKWFIIVGSPRSRIASSAAARWRLLLLALPSHVVGELLVASRVRGEGVTVHPLWAAAAAFRFGRVLAGISSLAERLDTRLMEWTAMQREREASGMSQENVLLDWLGSCGVWGRCDGGSAWLLGDDVGASQL